MSKFIRGARPCPFCGGTDIRTKSYCSAVEQWWEIFCHDCSCELKYFDTEKDAILAWETRNAPKPVDVKSGI